MDYEKVSQALNSGVYVFPCNGKKEPIIKKWKYKEGENVAELPALYWDKATYLAVQCGAFNKGIECIDFDLKYGEVFTGWSELVKVVSPGLYEKLYIERSPSGGMHVLYRCSNFVGNKKLASLNGSKDYAIETRGEGGYVIIAPSYKYDLVQGNLYEFPTITDQERDILINSAKTFNYKGDAAVKRDVTKLTKQAVHGGNSKVFEYFNANFNLGEYLVGLGWEIVKTDEKGCKYLKRPGTTNAHSATLDFHPGIFTAFSSNIEGMEPGKSYNYAQVYTIFEHGGDYKASYRAIKAMYFDKFDITGEKTGNAQVETVQSELPVIEKIKSCAKSYLMAGEPVNMEMIKSIQSIVGVITDAAYIKEVLLKYYEENRDFYNFDNFTPTYKAAMLIKNKFELYVNIVDNKLSVKTKNGRVEVVPSDIWLELSKSFEVKYDIVKRLCFNSKISVKHDPFLDYFESIEWNGEDEIAKLCSFIKVKNQATHDKMFKKMLVRSCRCVLGHGYNRYVWVYTGNQNNGKSTLIKFLCPKELMEYYTEESPSADHKDSLIRLQENFIYNWEELQEGRSQDLRRMKAIISKSEVKQRKSYAENEERKVRRASFFASTNDVNFLIDVENTRWLINDIISIDWAYRERVNINNLWAQVYKIYKANPDAGNLSMDESMEQAKDNENYEFHTNDEELLVANFGRAKDDNNPYNKWLTSSGIMNILFLRYSSKFQLNKIAIGRALMKRKYIHKRDSSQGGLTVFKVIDLNPTEISNEGVRNPYESEKEPLPF